MNQNDESLIFSTPQRVPPSHSGGRPMTMDSPNLSPIVSDIRPSPHRPYSAGTSTMLAQVSGGHVTTPLTASARRMQQRGGVLPGIAEETSGVVTDGINPLNHKSTRGGQATNAVVGSLTGTPVLDDKPPRHASSNQHVVGDRNSIITPAGIAGNNNFDDFGLKSLSLREKEKTRSGTYNRDFPIVTSHQPQGAAAGGGGGGTVGGDGDLDNSLNSISLLEEFNNVDEIPHHSLHQSLLAEDPIHTHQFRDDNISPYDIPPPQSLKKTRSKEFLATIPLIDNDEDDREPLDQYYHQMKRRENQRLIENVQKRWSKYASASPPKQQEDGSKFPTNNVIDQDDVKKHPETPLRQSGNSVSKHVQVSPIHSHRTSMKKTMGGYTDHRDTNDQDEVEITKEDLKKIRIALYPNTEKGKNQKHVRIVQDMHPDDANVPEQSSASDMDDDDANTQSQSKSRSYRRSRSPNSARESSPSSSSAAVNAALPVGSMFALILDKNQNPVLVPVVNHFEKKKHEAPSTSPHHSENAVHSEHAPPFRDDVEGSDEEMSAIYYYGDKSSSLPKNHKKRTSSAASNPSKPYSTMSIPKTFPRGFGSVRTASGREAGLHDSVLDAEISFLPGGNDMHHYHPMKSDAKRVKFDSYLQHNTSSFVADDDSSTSLHSISFISRPTRKSVMPTHKHRSHNLAQDRVHYFPINPVSPSAEQMQNGGLPTSTSPHHDQLGSRGYGSHYRPFVSAPINNDIPASGSGVNGSDLSNFTMLPRLPLNADILTPSAVDYFPAIPSTSLAIGNNNFSSGESTMESRDALFTPGKSIVGTGSLGGKNTGTNTKAWRSKLIKRDMTSVLHSPQMSKY